MCIPSEWLITKQIAHFSRVLNKYLPRQRVRRMTGMPCYYLSPAKSPGSVPLSRKERRVPAWSTTAESSIGQAATAAVVWKSSSSISAERCQPWNSPLHRTLGYPPLRSFRCASQSLGVSALGHDILSIVTAPADLWGLNWILCDPELVINHCALAPRPRLSFDPILVSRSKTLHSNVSSPIIGLGVQLEKGHAAIHNPRSCYHGIGWQFPSFSFLWIYLHNNVLLLDWELRGKNEDQTSKQLIIAVLD